MEPRPSRRLEEYERWFRQYALKERIENSRILLWAGKSGPGLYYVETFAVAEEDYLKDANGEYVRPSSQDLHWALAEAVNKRPREFMVKKVQRDAGKVGNFASNYGASPASLERKIKVDTGVEPEEGTGQAILDALCAKFPKAQAYLKACEDYPEQGQVQAYSGRIRHFHLHREDYRGLTDKQREDTLSPLKRESRNFECQHGIASLAARACMKLIHHYRTHGMKARVIALLYDSIVTQCPLEERHEVARLHQKYMTDETYEMYGGGNHQTRDSERSRVQPRLEPSSGQGDARSVERPGLEISGVTALNLQRQECLSFLWHSFFHF